MSAITYVLYDVDGTVTGVLSGSTETMDEPTGAFIEHVGSDIIRPRTHYILAGVVTPRAALTATWDTQVVVADGIAVATLATLPISCTVVVDGTPVVVNDGSFEFSADAPGDYTISIDEVTYLAQEWIVEAT